MKRVAWVLAASFVSVFVSLAASAGDLAKDTAVRIEGSGIEPGWFEGKIVITSEGCTMVKLARSTKDKYTMLALTSVALLQKKDGGGWKALSVDALKAHEPKGCVDENAAD
jgi:hypothetical protein